MKNTEKLINEKFLVPLKKICTSQNNFIFDSELAEYAENTIIKSKEYLPKLYRYSPADYYNIRGLETRTIYLSQIGKMNDVFEGLSGITNKETTSNSSEWSDIAFLKSFSELSNDLRMWSAYADNFSGMCVEYDVSKLPDNILIHLFPIIYSDSRSTKNSMPFSWKELVQMKKDLVEQNEPEIDFLKDIMGLFISKSIDWKYEKEWRLIFTYLQGTCTLQNVKDAGFESHSIFYNNSFNVENPIIDFDCATKIYIGPKTEKVKKEHLKEIGKKLEIEVLEMGISNTEYKLYEINKGFEHEKNSRYN